MNSIGLICGCRRTALSLIAIFAFSSITTAQSIYRPLGLQLGDQYRLAFVSEGKRDALSSNIGDYNSFVTDEANASNSIVSELQTDWYAIASTEEVDATENTNTDPTPPGNTGVPIYLVDGQTRIADHYDNLRGRRFLRSRNPAKSPQPDTVRYSR